MKLVLVRSDGTEARQLPIENGSPDNARFSPDSRRIAYRCFKAGMMSIRVTNLNGKNDRLLFKAEGVLGLKSMTWSPNGKHLAVVAFDWKLGEGGRRYRLAELDHNFRLLILDANGDHKRELKIRVADNQKVFQLRGPHWQ